MLNKIRFYFVIAFLMRLSLCQRPTTSAGYNEAFTQFQTDLCAGVVDQSVDRVRADV